jgi:hypothetical protein
MRAWMIVLSGAAGAIVVTAAIAVPELASAPRSEIGPILLAHSPVLATAALAVYALGAIVLTTASLLAGILRFRRDLARAADDRDLARREWSGAVADGFRQLAPRPSDTGSDGAGLFEARLNGNEVRSEIARLYYISLARCHFPSALIILAGLVALGVAQDHGSLPLHSAAIPTTSAALVMAGLVLLYILGRIAVDVTAEPLLETVSQMATERVETRLLRRAVELLELACNAPSGNGTPPAIQLPERLVTALEQGQHVLADAVSRLSAETQALEAVMRSAIEALDTTMRMAVARQPAADDDRAPAAIAMPELQAAVEELTAVLRRLSTAPEVAEEEPFGADPTPASHAIPVPRLARELRQLLQEIEAAR